VFDLMIGIDNVQRRTRRSFDSHDQKAPKRRIVLVRAAAAARLRTLADRLEPVSAGRPAGAYPR
jgi:hypothetical protein